MNASPNMTSVDVAWAALIIVVLVVCGGGLMFVSAAYIAPAVIGSPNYVPRHGFNSFLDFAIVFVGLLVGNVLALVILSALTRRLLPATAHRRWEQQLANGRDKMAPWMYRFAEMIARLLKPRVD